MRGVKWLITMALAMVVVVALVGSGPRDSVPAQSTPVRAYAPNVIERSGQMTQQMSTANASGHMFDGHDVDEQLQLSQSSAFVGQLEQRQRDIDRMLARGTP